MMEQEKEQDMVRVFVYGTLKKGYGNHRLLAGRSLYVGDDAINGTLFDLGSFPAALNEGVTPIFGELYDVGPNTLRDLDRLEGHPSFYRRELVKTHGGQTAWTYFLPKARDYKVPQLDGGSWPAK